MAHCACKVFFTSKGGGDKFVKVWLLASTPSDLFHKKQYLAKIGLNVFTPSANLNKLAGFINVSLFLSVFNPSSQCMPVWWQKNWELAVVNGLSFSFCPYTMLFLSLINIVSHLTYVELQAFNTDFVNEWASVEKMRLWIIIWAIAESWQQQQD